MAKLYQSVTRMYYRVHDFEVVFFYFKFSTFKIYLLRHFPTDFCDSTFNTKARLQATTVTNFIGKFSKTFSWNLFFHFFYFSIFLEHFPDFFMFSEIELNVRSKLK